MPRVVDLDGEGTLDIVAAFAGFEDPDQWSSLYQGEAKQKAGARSTRAIEASRPGAVVRQIRPAVTALWRPWRSIRPNELAAMTAFGSLFSQVVARFRHIIS